MTENNDIQVKNWPQAAVKIADITIKTSLIGGIFALHLYGVYLITKDMLDIDREDKKQYATIFKDIIAARSEFVDVIDKIVDICAEREGTDADRD